MTTFRMFWTAMLASAALGTPVGAIEAAPQTYEEAIQGLVDELASVCDDRSHQGRLAVMPFMISGSRRDTRFSQRVMNDLEYSLVRDAGDCFEVVARAHARQIHALVKDSPEPPRRNAPAFENIGREQAPPAIPVPTPADRAACGGDGRPHCLFDLVDWIVFGSIQLSGEEITIWSGVAPARSLVIDRASRRVVQARSVDLDEMGVPIDIFPREELLKASGTWAGDWTCGVRYEIALDLVERPDGEIFARLTLEAAGGTGADGPQRSTSVLEGRRRSGEVIELHHAAWLRPGPEGWAPLDARLTHRPGESVMIGVLPPAGTGCPAELARTD